MRAEYHVFDLDLIDDISGTLHVADFQTIGCSFQRWYFIAGVPRGVRRGGHAHKAQSECLICIQGSVTVHIEARGTRTIVPLATPGRALFLPAGYWRDLLDFSAGAILGVLASGPFDEQDYICDPSTFRSWEDLRANDEDVFAPV